MIEVNYIFVYICQERFNNKALENLEKMKIILQNTKSQRRDAITGNSMAITHLCDEDIFKGNAITHLCDSHIGNRMSITHKCDCVSVNNMTIALVGDALISKEMVITQKCDGIIAKRNGITQLCDGQTFGGFINPWNIFSHNSRLNNQ